MSRAARAAVVVGIPWALWAVGAVWMGGVGPEGPLPWRALALAVLAVAVGVGVWRGWGLAVGAAVLVAVTGWYLTLRPSQDRVWAVDQSRLPRVSIEGDQLTVRDLRTFRYRSADDHDARWVDARWDLSTLEGADFAVVRFTDNEAVAHTLVSFRFRDGTPLAISVEIRKEQGETYSPLRGLFRQYELMYVLADEPDVLGLRAVHRGETVYLHPMSATPEQARAYLTSLLRGAQALEARPAFYNTLTASCTTVLATHFTEVFDVPLDHRIYLPGYSDALAFELGLIDTEVDFEQTRALNRIDGRAQGVDPGAFSQVIRQGRSDRSGP